jgi:hypothetical protein
MCVSGQVPAGCIRSRIRLYASGRAVEAGPQVAAGEWGGSSIPGHALATVSEAALPRPGRRIHTKE